MLSILTAIGTLALLVSTIGNAKSVDESRWDYYPTDYCNGDFCYNYCMIWWEDYSAYYYENCWDWCNENVELNRADTLTSMMKEIKDRQAPAPACLCEDYCKVYMASSNPIIGGFPLYDDYEDYDDCVEQCKDSDDWYYDDGSTAK